jgi:hypothetical protein
VKFDIFAEVNVWINRSQWPRRLRHGFAADGLLGLRVRIPPKVCTSVVCECCTLLGTDLCEWVNRSSGRVLPTVVCLSVIVKPHQWEALAPEGCRATIKNIKLRFSGM